MEVLPKLLYVFFVLIWSISLKAQKVDSVLIGVDSSKSSVISNQPMVKSARFSRSLLVPVLMIAYGAATLKSDPLQDLNEALQRKIWVNTPHSKLHIENYLQFAPAVAVYGLNLTGVRGKNNFRDRSIIYFMSNVFLNVTVSSVKKFTHELRPDGSDYLSFPSGHTAVAFASAEFLRQEYKDVSAWYGIAGYLSATATGVLRMYNNRHWLSDIIAGAGVGIASTKLAYWLYPTISKKIFHKKESHTMVIPYYQNRAGGLSMLYIFH